MTEPDPLKVAQERGGVLLDNTTVAGVTIALEKPTEARVVDEQSLADALESVVLHESLVADSWVHVEAYPHQLLNLRDEAGPSGAGSSIFTIFPYVTAAPGAEDEEGTGDALLIFTTGLVGGALDRLERGLRSGEVARQHDLLVQQLGAGQPLSPLYGAPRDLRREILDLYGYGSPEGLASKLDNEEAGLARIRTLEDKIAERLGGSSQDRRLYAMFLLRAFYYEELAAAFSLSYVPHTFRAQALLAIPRRGEPAPGAFVDYATQLAAATRAELGKRLGGFNVTIDIPPIAAKIARDVKSRGELLPAALEIRATEPATAFRRWVAEQERLLQQQTDLLAIEKAKTELNEIVAELAVELLGNKREGGHPMTVNLNVGVPPLSAGVSTEVVLRAPSRLRRALRRRRPYLTFFSQLSRDVVSGNVPPFSKRLGELPP
jgi:hypothetical protein